MVSLGYNELTSRGFICKEVIPVTRGLIIPLHNKVVGGGILISLRPSVRPACGVRSATPTVLDGFFSY